MPVQNETKAYIELHIAVLLFGFTAILGDLIQLSAVVMVWWRMLITCISLLFLVKISTILHRIPRKTLLKFMGVGALVAIHWLCFFGAIKLSNASITLVCMATTSFFTACIEPLFLKQKMKWYEVGLGIMIIPGMALIVHSTDVTMYTGIVVGLISALLAALFATCNKILIHEADTMTITLVELLSGWLVLCLALPFALTSGQPFWPSITDLFYLCILALLCTTLAYVLSLRALKYISAFAANLTVNLEPVYGILLAWIILHENKELSPNFYWGVGIIIVAVFSYPALKKL